MSENQEQIAQRQRIEKYKLQTKRSSSIADSQRPFNISVKMNKNNEDLSITQKSLKEVYEIDTNSTQKETVDGLYGKRVSIIKHTGMLGSNRIFAGLPSLKSLNVSKSSRNTMMGQTAKGKTLYDKKPSIHSSMNSLQNSKLLNKDIAVGGENNNDMHP